MKLLKNTSFIFLTLFVSLFFFSSSVYADTTNFTLNSDPYQYINTDSFNSWKEKVLAYRDTKGISNLHYAIYWQSNKYQALLFTADSLDFFISDYSSNYPNLALSKGGSDIYYICNNNGEVQNCGASESSFVNLNISSCNKIHHTCDSINLLETDVPIISIESNTYILSYNDESFTYPNTEGLYSSVDWYNYYNGDDYPILTSFYSTFIDRLTYILDYISSSYVFLSVFVIFIFIFVLQLFRRLL